MKKFFTYLGLFIALSIMGHSYVIYRFIHDGILFTGPMMEWNKWFQFKCIYLINGVVAICFIPLILD